MEKAIVIDIDNTVICQKRRKQFLLSKEFDTQIGIDEIENDYEMKFLSNALDADRVLEFWRKFLSPLYYYDGQDIIFDGYDDCVSVVGSMVRLGLRVLYVTARDSSLESVENTIRNMKDVGLNVDRESIYFMDGVDGVNSNDDFSRRSRVYKKSVVKKISEHYDVIIGIGDSEDDMEAYSSCGVYAVQILHDKGRKASEKADLIVHSWSHVGCLVQEVVGGSSIFSDLSQSHTGEYGAWLADLDQKAQIMIVVNVGVLAFYAALYPTLRLPSNVGFYFISQLVSCLSLFASFVALLFAIRALASRSIRGSNHGGAIWNGWKDIVKCFLGRNYTLANSPISDAKMFKEMGMWGKKAAEFKFYMDNYASVDPKVIRVQRLLFMRSLNYSKIYAEQNCRFFTFVSLTLVFLLVLQSIMVSFLEKSQIGEMQCMLCTMT